MECARRSRMLRSLVILLAVTLVTLTVADADADRLRKRTRDRQIPDGWCPLERPDLLLFTADGTTARIRLTASDYAGGIGIDNVYVVDASKINSHLYDTICANDAYRLSAPWPHQAFFELFDLEVNGWRGAGAAFIGDSAPRLPFDDPMEPDGNGGSVFLHAEGWIEATVHYLVPGRSYYLGAWWSWDGGGDAHLNLEVDTLDPAALYLNEGRFRVDATWTTARAAGSGTAVPLSDDTGWFWFFNPANLEVVIKVLDGCSVNGHYWVFASGLTNTGVELRVRDTAEDETYALSNPRGASFQPVLETAAFDTCP